MLRARTPLLVVAFAPALLVISIGLIYLRTTCRMQLPTAQVLNSGLEGLPGLLHMWAQHAASHDEASALAQLAADLDEAIARFKSGEAIHPLPAKVQPALTTSSSAPACASAGSASTLESQVQSLAISGLQCHIAWNIDYWGDPLVWGDTHLTDTAADCCAACHAHQLAAARGGLDKGANSTACNTWSHCSDKEKCGDRYRQCWLKHLPSLPPPDGQGTPSVFSSGIVYDSDAWLASYDRKTRLTLRFQMGEVEVELLPELAPASVRELRRLVALLEGGSGNGGGGGGGGCNGCELYRIETAFLVQGVIRHPGGYVETPRHPNPPQKSVMERGLVCWAGGAGGPDFFVNLVDQPGFGDSHLCWGKVHDMALLDAIVQLPTRRKEKPDDMTFLQDFLPFNMSLS